MANLKSLTKKIKKNLPKAIAHLNQKGITVYGIWSSDKPGKQLLCLTTDSNYKHNYYGKTLQIIKPSEVEAAG